ncbi:unnamed protein product [Rotaria socialis]|uniref:Uncharacterized protein n=3 Tax=Rotaria socialis TaxID=392032 RepID=A0A817Z2Z7_9BILA|nr:unnamed protein product [Rotaria socialis]
MNAPTGDAKLTISKVDLQQHAGSVTCRLENVHGSQEETVHLNVLAAPLITTQLPKQEETVSGKDVTLRVVVRGSPRPDAEWFFNDTPITPENTSYDEEKSEYQLLLKEPSVTSSEGTYRVVLKNELGETESTPCLLIVLEPVKLTKIAPTTDLVDLKVGEPFEISVDADGKEAPKVQLTKDGKEMKFTSVEGTRHVYSVAEVKPEHQGIYKVTAKNKTSAEETGVNLNVTAPLSVSQPLADINVLMGQGGIFSFICDAFPAPKVTWFANDNELKNSTKHKIEAKQNLFTLSVNKCDNGDIGTYRAHMDNGIEIGDQTAKLNVGTKPTVVGKPVDLQVQIGQPARLQVQFTGQPIPDITWSRVDGQPLSEHVKIENDEKGLAVLVFDSTILPDKGSYVAKATNIVGFVEQKINLDVKEIKPIIIRDLEPAINATKGEPMTLTIGANGNPKPTARFFRGVEEILPIEGQIEFKESEDGQTFTATILSMQPNQQGDYIATVQNSGGMVKSKKCKVTVTKTPMFVRTPQDLTVADKSEAVFECEIDAFPVAKVTWSKDGKPLTVKDGAETQAQTDKGLYTLRIPQIDSTKHMGTIICRAENAIGNVEHPFQLNITTAPTWKAQLKDIDVLRGQDAILSIDYQGYPMPEIIWNRADKVLESDNEKIMFSEDRKQLTIRNVQIESEDEYNVRIVNEFGEITSKGKLNVLELPEIQPLLVDKDIQIREQIEYSTTITGRPLPEIQWLKNQKPLTASPPHIIIETVEEDVIKTTLRIDNIVSDDDGTYTIRAKNRAGQKESSSKLNVLAKLKFSKAIQDENIIQGQPVTFQCQIEAIPKPKVTFYINDQEVKSTAKIKVEAKGDVYTLAFSKVDLPDSGTIKVVADNGTDKSEITAKLNVCLKPSLVGKPTEAQVSIGQPARIQCTFTGLPMPQLTWSRVDGQPLNEGIEIANDENSGIAALVFNTTTMTDKGAYLVKATNIVGAAEQKVNLDVKEIKPIIIRDLEPAINATKGEPMTLTIGANGNPKPTARFFRGVEEILPIEGQIEFKESEDGQTFTATILSMQPNQQGDYIATVQNSGGMVKSKKCKVTVTKTPMFVRTPQDLTVADKSEAVFECEIDAYPNAKVSWIRDGKPLNVKDGVETQAQPDKGIYTLRIPQTDSIKHMGTIICRAENAIGNVEHPFQLNITTAPAIKTQLKDLETLRGLDAIFIVDVQGYPLPELTWLHGEEQLIESNDKYTWSDDQHRQLVIHNVQVTDEDEYYVRIRNEFGEVTSKAKLSCLITPRISPATVDDTILQRGDEIEYQFEIEGRPQVDVTWSKNGKELKLNENPNYIFTSDKENNKEIFKIVKADGDDQARYTLQIKNKVGKIEVNINIIVKASLQFVKKLTDVAATVGQPVTFSCECFGLPKPTATTWYFNDVELKGTAKYKIESKYPLMNLTVNKTDIADIGKYRVVVTNVEQTIENQADLLVQTKPKLEGKPQDAQPIIEETARIQCKFSGSQPLTVTWLKNGEPLSLPNDNIEVISEADTGVQALVFKCVYIEDKANYTVQVANMVGQAEGKMNLTPKEIKPTIVTDLEGKTVEKGALCELSIVAEGKPLPQCKWAFNNQDLTLIPGEIESVVDENDKRIYYLRIPSTQPKHIGEYSCTLSNGGGSVKSKKVKVSCEKSPQFASEFGKPVQTIQGEDARIECSIDAYPLPNFTWSRGSDENSLSDKDANYSIAFDTDQNASVLLIKQVKKSEHEDEYVCHATNEFGTANMRTKLIVLIRPYFIEPLKDTQCHEFTEQYAIEYQVDAYPEPTIEWTRNDEIILPTSNEFRIEKNRLVILETKLEHTGKYGVKLTNEVGEVESSMQLTVNERPIEIGKHLVDTIGVEKGLITLECVFTKPIEGVKWFKNGAELPDDARFVRKGEPNQRYFQLEVNTLTLDDTGEFSCIYNDGINSKATLTVNELPIDFEQPLSNQSLTEYDTLTLECTVTKPDKQVKWYFDSQELKPDDRCRFENEGKVHRLIINNVSPNDEGNYDVITESDRKSSAFVGVKEIPVVFVRPLTDIDVQERSSEIVLECELNKCVHVEWYRFATQLTSTTDDQRIFIEQNDLVYRLIIKNIQMDDQGTYTCLYPSQRVDSTCKVHVNELPLAFVQGLNEEYIVTENDDLILSVELNKMTPLKCEWLKDGLPIENNEHAKMTVQGERYQIKLLDVKVDDQAKYTFRINEVNLEGNTNVKINEIPIYFTRPLKDTSSIVEKTTDYRFDCEINKENKIAQWFKDDEQQALTSNDEVLVQSQGRIHSLIFNTIKLTHAGKYTCQFTEDIKSIGVLQVDEAATDFDIALQNVTLNEDEPLILECILTKDRPDDQVNWLFNGEPLLIDQERVKTTKVGPIVKLTIDECQLSDEGRYQAEINNKTSKALVTVKEKKIQFTSPLKDVEFDEWSKCILECEVNKRNAECHWYKDIMEIRPNDHYQFEVDNKTQRLIINRLELDDASSYSCVFRQEKTSGKLTVKELAYEFVRPLEETRTFVEKQELVLECETNKPLRDNLAIWTRDGQVLTHNPMDGILIKTTDKVHVLTIYETKMKDHGKYSCTIKEASTTCQVVMNEAPVEFIRPLENLTVTEGQPLRLSCTLSKDNCQVTWVKDDEEIKINEEEESRYVITNDARAYRLEMKESKMTDAGTYTIKVEDKELSCQVVITEAPIEIIIPLSDKTCMEATAEFSEFYVELNKPKVNLIWKCDDEPIDFTNPKYSTRNEQTKYTLVIRDIELSDEKAYSCQVSSGASARVKSSAHLTVDELQPEFVLTTTILQDRECFEDETVEFECELNKSKWKKTGQTIMCKWFRNVDREIRTTAKYSMERSGPIQKLIIHNAQFEDEAEYRCVIMDNFVSAKLTVNEIPVTFTQLLEDVNIIERETVTFQCEISKTNSTRTSAEIPIQWYRDGVKIVGGGRFEISKSSGNKRQTLKIINASLTDSGEYACTADTDKIRTGANLTVGDLEVQFLQTLQDRTVLEDQNLVLECIVNRTDKPISWFFNDQEIHPGTNYDINREKNKLRLVVKNVTMNNEGQYSCRVADVKTQCHVIVDEDTVRFIERLTDVGAKEGDSVTFQCSPSKLTYVKSKRDINFKWLHNGKAIDENQDKDKYKTEFDKTNKILKLTVNDIRNEDIGIITCQADEVTTIGKVVVEEVPINFVRKPEDQILTELPNICLFECELNRPGVQIKWLHNKKQLDFLKDKIEFHNTDTIYRLKILNVDVDDQGEYLCVARDKKAQAFLKLQVAPKIQSFQTNAKLIKRGQPLIIDVVYHGWPEPTIEWNKTNTTMKNKLIKNGNRQMSIESTSRSDSGSYEITLKNDYGQDQRSGAIEILDKPSKPRNVAVKLLDVGECELTWEEPEDDGGSPLTGYCIEKCEERRAASWDEVCIMSVEERTALVNRLLEGAKYRFRASAENKYGRSDPCETTEPLLIKNPFDPPSAPDAPLIDEIFATTCRIQWTPPSSDGGTPLTGYYVERHLQGATRWTKVSKQITPPDTTEIKAEELMEGSEYEFRIVACNKAGQSEPSAPSRTIVAKNPFDKPGPPSGLTIDAVGNEWIELSWQPPIKDGGSPITGYVVERRTTSNYKWHAPTDPIEGTTTKLHSLHTGHKYEFRVRAQNAGGVGEPSSPTKETEIKEPIIGEKPRFIQELEPVTVVSGRPVTLTARVKGDPTPEFKWLKNDNRVVQDDHLKLDITGDTVKLVITEAVPSDAGSYELIAENALGSIDCAAKLIVQSPPTIVSSTPSPINVPVGQVLYISCEVSGYPRPEMTWEPANDRFRTEQSDTFVTLSISKVRVNEGGTYKLVLKNAAGSAEASFDVRIQNVPQPVRNLTIDKIQAESVHIKWTAPLDDGGLPINSYFVEYRDMRRSQYVRSERLSGETFDYQLTRLTKGSKYTVRVLAENKLGQSEPTEIIEPFIAKNPFDVPSAPRELKVTGVTRSSCQLQWLPPNNDGGAAIQGYIIERQTETRWIRAVPTLVEGTTIQLVDLIEGSIYDFRVAAVNEEGQGAYSRPSESVTIKDPYDVPTQPGPIDINELTDTSCVLAWKPPIRDNGSPVIEYIIEQRFKSDPSFIRLETEAPVTECFHKLENLVTNGEYEFRVAARNKAGLSAYSQTDRNILIRAPRQGVAPQIEKLISQTLNGGTQGRLEATVTGSPEPEIIWYRGGRKLPLQTGRYTSSLAQSLLVLYIKDVQENDAGQYTLEVQNEFGSDSKQIQVNVLATPKIEFDAKYRKQIVVDVNSSVRIPFAFSGSPKPELTLSRSDESKENHATLDLFENSGTLLLRQVTRPDTGVYRLQATNECGTVTARIDILVQTVPSPPGGPLQVTASGKDYVSLAWHTCEDDGGSELSAFIIEKREENKAIWTKVVQVRPTNTTYTCTGLLDKTNYFFRILAENEMGIGEPLELEHVIMAKLPYELPGSPVGPVKIDSIIQTGCTLSWSPATDDGGAKITGYVIEGKDVNRQAWIPLENVPASETTVDVRQLKEDATYTFRIMSKNIVGLSQPLDSESVTLKRPNTVPHAPVPFFVSDVDIDSCILEWEIPKFSGGENIQLKNFIIEQRIGDKESTPWKVVAEPDAFLTSTRIGHLVEEKEYYFRIKAVNEIGQSKPTELTRPVIPRQKSIAPSAPIGPISTLMVTRDSITISWGPCKDDGGSELIGYVIEKRDASRNTWQRIGYNDPSTFTYTTTGLIEDAAYHFRVYAENSVGMSSPLVTVDPIVAKSPYTRPDKPEGPLITKIVSASSIDCTWQPPLSDGGTTLTGYLIQRRDITRPIWVKAGHVNGDICRFTIKDLPDEGSYLIQIFSENSEGQSLEPLAIEQPVKLMRKVDVPEPPAKLDVIAKTDSSITLQWEMPRSDGGSPLTEYLLEMRDKKGKNSEWTQVQILPTITTSFRVTKLNEDVYYNFRIKAANTIGYSEPKTLEKAVKPDKQSEPPSMPDKPLEITNIDSTSIALSWKPSSSSGSGDLLSYIIERRDVLKANWTAVKKVSSNQYNLLISELTEGSSYYFRVCAVNEDDLQSEWLELDGPALCRNPYDVPSPPKNLVVKDIIGQTVTIQWDAPENDGGKPIRGYNIERRDVQRATWLKEGRCKTTTFEIESLPLGGQHLIRVTAENEEGLSAPCEIDRAVQIDAKDISIPKPRDVEIGKVKGQSLTLTWLPATGSLQDKTDTISSYVIEVWDSEEHAWRELERVDASETSYTRTDLKTELSYQFRLRTLTRNGRRSSPTRETQVLSLKRTIDAPDTPEALTITDITDDSFILKWREGSLKTKRYIVEKREASKKVWVTAGETTETSICVEHLMRNVQYELRVFAQNASGDRSKEAAVLLIQFKGRQVPPGLCEELKVKEHSPTACLVTWLPPSDTSNASIRNYIVEKQQVGRLTWQTVSDSSQTCTCLVNELTPNVQYKVRVAAINEFGQGEFVETEPIQIKEQNIPPSKPVNLTVTDMTYSSIDVSWLCPREFGSKPIKHYVLYRRSTKAGSEWKLIHRVNRTQLSYTFDNLDSSLAYSLRVTAESDAGESESCELPTPVSPKKKAKPPAIPDHVFVRTIDDGIISIQWSGLDTDNDNQSEQNSNLLGYIVEMNDGRDWVEVERTDSFTRTCTTTHLRQDTDYSFRVSAYNRIGQGRSKEIDTPVKAKSPFSKPGQPSGPLNVSNLTRSTVDLNWSPSPTVNDIPITNYFVEKFRDGIWIKVARLPPTSTSLKVFNLIENKDVLFRVSAENRFGISEPLQSMQVKPNRSFETKPPTDLDSTAASYFEKNLNHNDFNFLLYHDSPPSTTFDTLKFGDDIEEYIKSVW